MQRLRAADLSEAPNGEPCETCTRGRGEIEIMYFGDGHSGAYWVCKPCARSIWRAARDQGRELQWGVYDTIKAEEEGS